MFSKTTRLEMGIVVTVLLVLFLCRQPPKSGNADVRRDAGLAQRESLPGVQLAGQDTQNTAAFNPQSANLQPATATAPADTGTSHNGTTEPPLPPPPQIKPLGLVDARKCPGLNYNDILYGEVTVRWVWDGGGFVAHKVVVVREKSGVVSTWTLDERDDSVARELPQQTK